MDLLYGEAPFWEAVGSPTDIRQSESTAHDDPQPLLLPPDPFSPIQSLGSIFV